ncbi:hypothetical protein C122C_0125 [Leuconostoc gelidum subsp. gasicomitatum]|uniref:Uncharacterized protein n=2 Tax=Leuconostoc TaxID=1243 RepID=A0ABP2B3N0_9LACO|nr:hypothetical protein LEGAS_0975 [Leuconostoc gasicomitatum LMG 18811]CUW09949.1 hypothetical protein KSL4_1626 [Leuconostoc inhae]CUW15005.1 hypothetical protein C122C_0125 [Leuconostoc gasicomitatum]
MSAEHQKLVEANLVNAITQANSILHQANITFDKEQEMYNDHCLL